MIDQVVPAVAPDAELNIQGQPEGRTEVRLNPLNNGNFLPETPGGLLVNCIEDIRVFLTNQVVKTFEKGGAANGRFLGMHHRVVKKKFGQKFELNKANWYIPKSTKDIALAAGNRSTKMTDYAAHLSDAQNRRFIVTSKLFGFPFSYDSFLAQLYNREDLLEGRFFPPNTHIDVHITLRRNLGLALRSLASDDTDDQDARIRLRALDPRVVLDELNLLVDKVVFPEGHPFILSLLKKRSSIEALIWPTCGLNEVRDSIVAGQTMHVYRVNLTQLQFPAYIKIFWMRQQQFDGSNGYNLNTTVFKFVPNLESLDVTMAEQSLLPTGGPVTKLSSTNIDNMEKWTLFKHQANFRRDPDSINEFYAEEAVQQFLVIPLTHLYAHKPPSEWSTLSPIHIQMGFTNDLSPAGWQVAVAAVTEGQLGLRNDGSHFALNAAGAKIDGA